MKDIPEEVNNSINDICHNIILQRREKELENKLF
jgi:hypothetical protein